MPRKRRVVDPDPEPPAPEPEPSVLSIAPRPDPPESYLPTTGPAVYRTVIAARGLADINNRLAEGWELIMGEFCEEVLQRSTTSRMPTSTAYQPYALLGKREPLMEKARAALADADDRAAVRSTIPQGNL
jgi:hypothetical protein